MTSAGRAVPARKRARPRHRRCALHRRPGRAFSRPAPRLAGAGAARARTAHGARRRPGARGSRRRDDADGRRCAGRRRHRRRRATTSRCFPREVMFHRQPVAWVLAETLDAAQRGADRVTASSTSRCRRFSPSNRRSTPEAISPTSCASRAATSRRSRPARCASTASLRIGGQEHFYLETQAAIAWMDETGGVAAARRPRSIPSETQEVVARVLGLPRHQVTVECLRMGGAFGGKEVQANAWAAIAALGAWKTRRPVRVRLTRELDMALTGKRHPVPGALRSRLLRRRPDRRRCGSPLYSDGGWSLDLSEPIMWRSLFHCDNAYHLPAVDVSGRVCRTHKTSQTAFRGFGGPQAMLVIEEILSQAAQRLSLPADVVRERNFYREGDTTHYGQVVEDAERLGVIWERLKETSRFDARRDEIAAFNARHDDSEARPGHHAGEVRHLVHGDVLQPGRRARARLPRRHRSGEPRRHGDGPGSLHQDPPDRRRRPRRETRPRPRDVRLAPTRCPNTSATAASAGTDLNGAAVVDACAADSRRGSTARCREPSGRRLPCRSRNCARRRTCSACRSSRRASTGRPTSISIQQTGRGKPFHYFAFGAAVSEVEVDRFTGAYRLLRTDILAGRRRLDLAGDRSRSDRRRIPAGRGLAHARRAALGRARAGSPRAAHRPTSCHRGRRCRTCSR